MPIGEVIAMDRAGCDLSRPRDLPRIISELKPDVIVNAAAYTAVDRAEEEERLATIVNGTAVGVLADEARKSGTLLIHYSTDYVFDGTKKTPYTEDDPPRPINAYGRSKLAGERAVVESAGDYLILRTCWVYSARGHNFLRTILRLAQEHDELRIVADQVGAPTWAREIADATVRIVQRACDERARGGFTSEVFNVTAAGATSWHGFAEAILDQAMSQGLQRNRPKVHPISSLEYPTPATRPKNSRLAGERLHARYGIALAEWKQALALCMQDETLAEAS
jgi:dTDP-4-dehydrorhamnose reductase